MNKYFKYILVFMSAFLVLNTQVMGLTLREAFEKVKEANKADGEEIEKRLKAYGDAETTIMDYYGKDAYVFKWEDTYGQEVYSAILNREGTYIVQKISVKDEKRFLEDKKIYRYSLGGPQDAGADTYTDEPDVDKIDNPYYSVPQENPERPTYGTGNDSEVSPITPSETSCSDLFSGVRDVIKPIFNAIKIIIPILVIALSALDFAKAIFGSDDGEIKKAQGKFIKRLIVAFIFFLLPTFVSFIMGIMNGAYNGNWNCIIID